MRPPGSTGTVSSCGCCFRGSWARPRLSRFVFDPLRIDVGLGAIIGLPQVDAGFVYSLDPKWTVHDHVFAGLHLEKSHFFSSGEDEERIGNISPKPSLLEGHLARK